MPFGEVVDVCRPLQRAADGSPWLSQIERRCQRLIAAHFADLVEDGGVLVPEKVDARRVLKREYPPRRLRVGKEVELDSGRDSDCALLIQKGR